MLADELRKPAMEWWATLDWNSSFRSDSHRHAALEGYQAGHTQAAAELDALRAGYEFAQAYREYVNELSRHPFDKASAFALEQVKTGKFNAFIAAESEHPQ